MSALVKQNLTYILPLIRLKIIWKRLILYSCWHDSICHDDIYLSCLSNYYWREAEDLPTAFRRPRRVSTNGPEAQCEGWRLQSCSCSAVLLLPNPAVIGARSDIPWYDSGTIWARNGNRVSCTQGTLLKPYTTSVNSKLFSSLFNINIVYTQMIFNKLLLW